MSENGEVLDLLKYDYFFCNENKFNSYLCSKYFFERDCVKKEMQKYNPDLIIIGVTCFGCKFISEKFVEMDNEIKESKIFEIKQRF